MTAGSMLRPFVARTTSLLRSNRSKLRGDVLRRMSTWQCGTPPTALATLHLEDGTSLTGKSFGSHEAVEGEVSSSDPSKYGWRTDFNILWAIGCLYNRYGRIPRNLN